MVKHPVEEHIKKILSPAYVDMLRKQTYETSEGRQKLGYAKHKIQKINTALKTPVTKKMLLKKYPSIESKAKQVRKMIADIQYSKKGGSVNELKKLEKELDMIMRKVRDPRIRNRLPRFKELRRKIRRLREIHEMDLDDRKKMRRGGMVDDDDIESIDLDMDDLDDMDMELDTDMFEGEDGYITDEETINPSRTTISPETRREYFIDDQLGEDFVFDEDIFGSGLNQVRENNLFGLESIQLGRRTRSL